MGKIANIASFGIVPFVNEIKRGYQQQEAQRDARAQAILSGLESFDRTYATLPSNMDAGQQALAVSLFRQRTDAQAWMSSGDRQLIASGIAGFEAANEGLRTLVRSLPIDEAQKRAHLAELQARADPAEGGDAPLPNPHAEQQRQRLQKRGSELQKFQDLARSFNNPDLMAEVEKRKADLDDDRQAFLKEQAAEHNSRAREVRENVKTARLLTASNERELRREDRKNAIEYGKEFSDTVLTPLQTYIRFYETIMESTDEGRAELPDIADLTTAGIAINKMSNPQAEASDAAVQLATGNLAMNIWGFQLADARDDWNKGMAYLFGTAEVSPERIKDIRRNATVMYNSVIRMAQSRAEDIASQAGLTLRFPEHISLVGLERINTFSEAEVPPQAVPEEKTFVDRILIGAPSTR